MTTTTIEKYQASLERAEHHNETWEQYEDELLFDGDVALVAEVLGRTTYAVTQRRYALRNGAVAGDRAKRPEQSYRGWTCDMGDGW